MNATQNSILDAIATGATPSGTASALSLRPDAMLSHAAACGHPVALAIIEAWKPHHKVTVMPAAEFDKLLAEQSCLFTGQAAV